MRQWCAVLLAASLPLVSSTDSTPPVLTIDHVQEFIFHFLVTINLNEAGTVYCGALANTGSGTYTPSTSQLKTDTALDGHGSATVAANTLRNVVVNGLSPATTYDIYCYAEDNSLNGQSVTDIANSRQASISTLAGGDYTAPTLIYRTPFNHVEAQKVVIYVQLSEDGTVYCAALEDSGSGTTQPSSYQIRDNVDVDDWGTATILAANSYKAIVTLENLVAATTYDYYCFATDVAGNGIDRTPAFDADLTKIAATKRTITTLNILIPSSLRVFTAAQSTTYRVEPAAWNIGLPTSFTSGCQDRRQGMLESWSEPPEFESAQLLSHLSDPAKGCHRFPAAPRGGGPFIVMLRRGRCPFSEKARKAQNAGFKGMLVVDYQSSQYHGQLPDMAAPSGVAVEILSWIISKTDGEAISTAFDGATAGRVTVKVVDTYRKPVLGERMTDVFGTRLYVTQ